MELITAIEERKSIRKFKSDPVPRAILEEILEIALRAPSAINTQPWEFWVVGGETLRKLAQGLYEEGIKGEPPRADFALAEIWKEPYLNRMRENGKRLFGLLGFDRQDKEQRKAFSLSMLKFFDAPQAIFLCVDSCLGDISLFDCGCFVQTLCLLATSRGLGTCIQQSGVFYPDIIRKYVSIPQEKKILISIAIGHPDWGTIINQFRSNREPLENFVHWQDVP